MSFDAAQWEILAPACGSTVVMGAPGVYRDPEAIIATIKRHGVTTLQCVPTLLQALIDTENLSSCHSLRNIFSGGEALSRSLAAQCLDAMPTARLVNLYGPTECTINASAFVVDRAAVDDGPRTMPVGTPVSGTTFHILDPQGKPVAIGEIGELHIGGIQVARGYLGRLDLTADRFVDDPFSTTPEPASTAPAIWPTSTPTARSSSSAAPTTRSSCAATGSSSTRSARRSRPTTGSAARPSCCTTTMPPGSRTWWPSSSSTPRKPP